MTLGATLKQSFGAATIYSPDLNYYEGMATPGFFASLGE